MVISDIGCCDWRVRGCIWGVVVQWHRLVGISTKERVSIGMNSKACASTQRKKFSSTSMTVAWVSHGGLTTTVRVYAHNHQASFPSPHAAQSHLNAAQFQINADQYSSRADRLPLPLPSVTENHRKYCLRTSLRHEAETPALAPDRIPRLR